MDSNNRQRRQNEPPHPPQNSRYNAEQNQIRSFSGSSPDRYRPVPIATSPSAGRAEAGAAAYSGYYQEPAASFPAALPANALGYQPTYPQDQRQQSGFNTYSPELMYNVAQQAPPNNVYESTQQFQGRQPAGMQMLSDVAGPYFTNEAASAAGPPSLQNNPSSGSSTVYQQHQQSPADRAALLQQGYPSNLAMGGVPQAHGEIMEGEDYSPQGPLIQAAYTTYQTKLKEVFQNIINGNLAEASQSLLELSEWFLGHVGDLGLTVDENTLWADRIRLWGEFNTAWLSIFQKQKDMLESGQRIQAPQSLISQDFIHKMAGDLIRMCDGIEKHGLIDYQYGVEEEQIIMILEECLDLQESIEGVGLQSPALGRAPP